MHWIMLETYREYNNYMLDIGNNSHIISLIFINERYKKFCLHFMFGNWRKLIFSFHNRINSALMWCGRGWKKPRTKKMKRNTYKLGEEIGIFYRTIFREWKNAKIRSREFDIWWSACPDVICSRKESIQHSNINICLRSVSTYHFLLSNFDKLNMKIAAFVNFSQVTSTAQMGIKWVQV